MTTIIGRATKMFTAAIAFCLALIASTVVFGQGTQGPDRAGSAIGNVSSDAILLSDLDNAQGQCLANIVDELVSTISKGKIKVEKFSVTGNNNMPYENIPSVISEHEAFNFPAFKVRIQTTLGCDFEIIQHNRKTVQIGADTRYTSHFEIKGGLYPCPNAFPEILNRGIMITYSSADKDGEFNTRAHAHYAYTPKTVYKLDAFGGILDQKTYALNPFIQGSNTESIDFLAYRTDIVVFSYPSAKYRQCLQRGLSGLAKK